MVFPLFKIRLGKKFSKLCPDLKSYIYAIATLIAGIIPTALSAQNATMPPTSSSMESEIVVLFFGDSLTAGYELSKDDAYPALIQNIAASEGISLRTINAGLIGDTTAGGLRRLDWFLRQRFDIAVVALGANDGLRGLSPVEISKNLSQIIDKLRTAAPHAQTLLTGMRLPPTYGAIYETEFSAVFPAVALEKKLPFLPFLLEGVAGSPLLNLPDRLHPNEAGHKIIAGEMWKFIRPFVLQRRDASVVD